MYKIVNDELVLIQSGALERIKGLLSKLLSKQSNDRFQSTSEFEDRLNKVRDLLNANASVSYDMDTEQLKQMKIFEGCNKDVLHELTRCIEFDST